MDVHVDEPGQHGEPRTVDALARDMLRKLGNDAVLHADIQPLYTLFQHNVCIFYDHDFSSFP